MASVVEILGEMRSSPAGVRFADACKVVTSYFGEPRQNGTSHKVWKMPWAGDSRVNMQMDKSRLARAYQVRQALQAIDRLDVERAAATKQAAARKKAAAKQADDDKKAASVKKSKPKKGQARKPKSKKRRS